MQICKELSDITIMGQGDSISGVDGGHLPEYFLGKRIRQTWDQGWDFQPELLRKNCQGMSMDSPLVFHHCDLGPFNIMVQIEAGEISIGVIDWECAGFVPQDWVRTKYVVSGGMDFDLVGGSREARRDFRDRMQLGLGQHGYREASESWQACRSL